MTTSPAPGQSEAELILDQTIAWLNQFIRGMTAENWRDMRLQAERQLDDLPAAIAALSASAAPGVGDEQKAAADFYATATPREARKHALRKYAVTDERREGHSKLVYNKATRTIDTVDPHPQEMADIADETDISPGNYLPPSPATQPAPGMVCVPVEPTEEMIEAFYAAHAKSDSVLASAAECYRAMTAAALASQAKGRE